MKLQSDEHGESWALELQWYSTWAGRKWLFFDLRVHNAANSDCKRFAPLPDLVIKNLNHHQTSNVQELYLLIISPGKYSLSRPSAAIPFLHHAATTWRHWKTADYWWIDANGRCNAIHDFIDKSPPNSPSNTLLYFQKTTNNGGAHAAQVKCPTTISSTLPDSASPESSWEFRLQPAGNFCSRWAFWPCRHSEKKSHP